MLFIVMLSLGEPFVVFECITFLRNPGNCLPKDAASRDVKTMKRTSFLRVEQILKIFNFEH